MERVWFLLCLSLGRLLRAARYSTVAIVEEDGACRVRKRRRFYAPLLVRMGEPLTAILDAGVQVLPQHEWENRERLMYRSLYGTSIGVEGDGVLVLPCLAGRTLATLLEDPQVDEANRRKAVELAVGALIRLHHAGFTHGDAMAENVMVDLDTGAARWFDFETMHAASRPLSWRRADDLRALLCTCLLRTAPGERADTLRVILDVCDDEEVTRILAASFTSVLRRPLAFHLGQAPLSFQQFREIDRLLKQRLDEPPADRPH